MYGKATLEIPRFGTIGPMFVGGLSDQLAVSYGSIAAWTLSEEDGFVVVTLSDGTVKTIGHDTLRGCLVFGRLVYGQTWER